MIWNWRSKRNFCFFDLTKHKPHPTVRSVLFNVQESIIVIIVIIETSKAIFLFKTENYSIKKKCPLCFSWSVEYSKHIFVYISLILYEKINAFGNSEINDGSCPPNHRQNFDRWIAENYSWLSRFVFPCNRAVKLMVRLRKLQILLSSFCNSENKTVSSFLRAVMTATH